MTYRPGLSNVTEINFTKSAVEADAIESLLSGISALEKFTYHQTNRPAGNAYYKPSRYVSALREYAATSLQLLDITRQNYHEMYPLSGNPLPVGSLQMFTSLNRIRLEDTAFEKQDYQYGEPRDDEDPYRKDLKKLIDILPISITVCTLITANADLCTKTLFNDMAKCKDEKLPNLTNVEVECGDYLDEYVKKILERAEFELGKLNISFKITKLWNGYR